MKNVVAIKWLKIVKVNNNTTEVNILDENTKCVHREAFRYSEKLNRSTHHLSTRNSEKNVSYAEPYMIYFLSDCLNLKNCGQVDLGLSEFIYNRQTKTYNSKIY